ncbi:MAG: hypothetical protein SF339_06140, partial [Blastocatellia bacterium]|nr:hypothetical protein [Blastocatellia bacterium]
AEATNSNATGKVEFIQYHKPTLKAGRYEISVTQEIHTNEASNPKIPSSSFPAARSFVILGERFELKPEEIQTVFPPDGSLGDHSNVLPHVILQRSTLPWERSSGVADAPWLALLLFDQTEAPTPRVITLEQLKKSAAENVRFPVVTLEDGQSDADKVVVIDVRKQALAAILPSEKDLALLAHVRQMKDDAGKKTGEETAVVIGNRLPRSGALSTAHLVSLEARYKNGSFDFQGAGENDLIRLVSLKSWSFACADQNQSFEGLLANLNRTPGTLRLPVSSSPVAEKFLSKGFVPLKHHLRKGEQTWSFYHGPLVTGYHDPLIAAGGSSKPEVSLPARAADELLRYDPTYGLLDASYAAAWELGRMLALQSRKFSVSLYNWKRAHAQHLAADEQRLIHSHLAHLAMDEPASPGEKIPDEIASWFRDLNLLRGVPFNYLVPDERMLPAESIRFFHLDESWMDCLLDGAFSIGRVTTAAVEQDGGHSQAPTTNALERVTGFLLRSDVVAGWPGLLIDAYDSDARTSPLKTLRMDRLSKNILLCLFAGEAKLVDFHLKPETMHFGLDRNGTGYSKILRDAQGITDGSMTVATIPFLPGDNRTLAIASLAESMGKNLNAATLARLGPLPLTSAPFALQMIEGAAKVVLKLAG